MKYAYIKTGTGTMKVQILKKCSECEQVPYCTLFDLHEYNHNKECSRS